MEKYEVTFRNIERKSIFIRPELMYGLMENIHRSNQPSPIAVAYDDSQGEYLVLNMNDVLCISLVKDSETANYEV